MAIRVEPSPAEDPAVLAEQARGGSSAALGELYGLFGSALFRLAYRLTASKQDAEDVVHDVFVGLPEALGRYEERGQLAAWLRRVTARVALMRLRGQARRRETGVEDAAAIPAPIGARADQVELWAAVDALPATLRSVLVLKEMEGYSHAEVAGLLGISVVASRVRLLRALRRVRRQLEEER